MIPCAFYEFANNCYIWEYLAIRLLGFPFNILVDTWFRGCLVYIEQMISLLIKAKQRNATQERVGLVATCAGYCFWSLLYIFISILLMEIARKG